MLVGIQAQTARDRGFTLVEVLIVVVILGVLASIVLPQFVSATDESREGAVKMNLHRVRTQIYIYQQHHDGRWPTLANIADQLTEASNLNGDTGGTRDQGYIYGPYILEFPTNARTSTNTVGDGDIGTSAWYYNQDTGTFRANDSVESSVW